MMRALWRGIRAISVDQWRAIDRETQREPGWKPGLDWRVIVVLVTTCVTLTLQEYLGDRTYFQKLWPYDRLNPDEYWQLKGFGWWSGWRLFGYLILPMLVVAFMPGERVRSYNLSLAGFTRHLRIYVLLFALVAPAVYLASKTSSFQHTYPFYKWANRSTFDFWAWQAMYAVQFLSLEFFFRGFMLEGLRRAMGSSAIFVMIVPYCMIHYGKPMAETLGAIGAGVILGTLAMRTRSIWGGVLIHVGVATMMDLLAVGYCPDDGRRPCPDD